MSCFTEWLEVRHMKGDKLITLKDYIYHIHSLEDDDVIVVPKWFVFDGASIPRVFWTIIGHPMQTKVIKAACLHDYLYINKIYSRKRSDVIYFEALLVAGVGMLRAILHYVAVRVWWWYMWDKWYRNSIYK